MKTDKKMKTVFRCAAFVSLALFVSACGKDTTDRPVAASSKAPEAEIGQGDMGPSEYDASGTMPCSAGSDSFNETCGWRVLRDGSGGAEIWISNIASEVNPAYRVLTYSNGSFTARDGTPLEVSRDADMWIVTAADGGKFRFAHSLITGG